jgi:hypothetical protein
MKVINSEIVVGMINLTHLLGTKPLMSESEIMLYEKGLTFLDTYFEIVNQEVRRDYDTESPRERYGGNTPS